MIASCGATCDKESLRYNKNLFYEHKQILYTSCDQLFCRMLFLIFIIKCIMYKALKWMWKLHYKHQIPSLPNITEQFLPLKESPFFLSWPVFVISFSISENEVIPHSFSLTGKYSRRTVMHCVQKRQSVRVFADIYWAARNVAPDTKKTNTLLPLCSSSLALTRFWYTATTTHTHLHYKHHFGLFWSTFTISLLCYTWLCNK